MNTENFEDKFEIAFAAAQLYSENDGAFTIAELAVATGKEQGLIYDLFPNKKAILHFYYTAQVFRYRLMVDEIDDFAEFSLSEKLSNFFYTTFDMLHEQHTFVELTFNTYFFNPFEKTEFEKEVEELIKDFFREDSNLSFSSALLVRDYFFGFLKHQYLGFIKFWLNDDSDQKSRTFALVDKFTSFIEEVVYNKVIDKGFDFTKYAITSSGFLDQFPIMKDFFNENKSEEEETDDSE